jgi:hypothetical protein
MNIQEPPQSSHEKRLSASLYQSDSMDRRDSYWSDFREISYLELSLKFVDIPILVQNIEKNQTLHMTTYVHLRKRVPVTGLRN